MTQLSLLPFLGAYKIGSFPNPEDKNEEEQTEALKKNL